MNISEDIVPSNLYDAIDMLMAGVGSNEIEAIKKTSAEEMSIKIHFAFGMHIRNTWSLWEDTPLTRWFRGIGISHPDDMSSIINTSFCRRVRGEEICLDDQVKKFQEYWTKKIGKPVP